MAEIVMQFVANGSLSSRLIEWFDHGRYSHVDTVLPDGTLLGARNDDTAGIPAGVQIRPSSYVGNDTAKRITISCTDKQADTYYGFVHAQIGKPYDRRAIAAFAFGRDWRDESEWFCSELNAAALEEAGVVRRLAAPVNKIAPDDLLLVISALVPIE